jgi:hypothetical protein
MLAEIIRAFEQQQHNQQQQQQQEAPASAEQIFSSPTHADSASVQSPPDLSYQGSAFDIDMIVNSLLQEGHFLNKTPSPILAEGDRSGEMANFMLPSMWTDTIGQTAWNPTVESITNMETEGDIDSA